MVQSREQAKEILVEIVHQAGAISKLKLDKAFWLAHLYYYQMAPGFLSDWPVVRLPHGPGIDRAGALLGELEDEERLTLVKEQRGPFTEICCRPGKKAAAGILSELARQAIGQAVTFVKPLSPADLGEMRNQFSRSWNTTPDGEELDIYTDLQSDEDFENERRQADEMREICKDVFQ